MNQSRRCGLNNQKRDVEKARYWQRTIGEAGKRQVLAVWTVLVSIGILPSGHFDGVHLEDYGHFESSDVV